MMDTIISELDWSTIIPTVLVVLAGGFTSRWAWSKLPKKDMGSAALASVEAAEAAVALSRQVNEDRLEQLEERVRLLEELVIAKETENTELLTRIELLERWIAALMEQLAQHGIEPVTMDQIGSAMEETNAIQPNRSP